MEATMRYYGTGRRKASVARVWLQSGPGKIEVNARPVEQKKGADKGIDGKIVFQGGKPGQFESVIISVKAGHTNVAHVRDLRGVVEREKAAIGVLISMQEPTAPMRQEAVTWG